MKFAGLSIFGNRTLLQALLVFMVIIVVVQWYQRSNYFERIRVYHHHSLVTQSNEIKENENEQITARKLYNKVRVVCWIMTQPDNHESKAQHVKVTWGRRCHKLVFISSKDDEKLGAVAVVNGTENREWLWAKTKGAFKYVWDHYQHEADWFLKADDDTYVIMENLRGMLNEYSPKTPIYFGCRFKPYVDQGYMSGGAGYVLSKEALRRFVEDGLTNKTLCEPSNSGTEDVEMGKCMENVGVEAGDSRDKLGRFRFLPFIPQDHVPPGKIDKTFWYWDYIYYPQEPGMNCCSNTTISFHYVNRELMYVLEFLIYQLNINLKHEDLPFVLPNVIDVETTTVPMTTVFNKIIEDTTNSSIIDNDNKTAI